MKKPQHRLQIPAILLLFAVACTGGEDSGKPVASLDPLADSSWPTEILNGEASGPRKLLLASIEARHLAPESAQEIFAEDFRGEDFLASPELESDVRSGVALTFWGTGPELDAESFRQNWNAYLEQLAEVLTLETHTWEIQLRPQADGSPGLETHIATWILGRLEDGRVREERLYLILDSIKLADGTWRISRVGSKDRRTTVGPGPYFQDVTAQVLPPGYDQIGAQIYTDGGPVLADFDGDRDVDLFLPRQHAPARLYANDGRGYFTDVTAERGLELNVLRQSTNSGLFLDVDNDGALDLVVGSKERGLLVFRNDGSRFHEATGPEPLGGPGEWESLAAADYDGDGWIDVYLCNYNRIDADHQPESYVDAADGLPNVLLRNRGAVAEGESRFVDVTEDAGLEPNRRRWSYAAAWADYDRDGDLDLYVANDYGPNSLYRNRGDGGFEEVTVEVGAEDHGNGMAVSWVDVDGDLWLDLYISNMQSFAGNRITQLEHFPGNAEQRELYHRFSRGNSLLLNQGDGTFVDATVQAGVKGAFWAWGNLAFDYDADSDIDLFSCGGFYTGASAKDT